MMMLRAAAALLLMTAAPGLAADKDARAATLAGTTLQSGLLPVHLDVKGGRILLELPPADADGVSGRFLYMASLKSGLGSAPIGLDRAQPGPAQILVFRRLGKKIALELENPRFLASTGDAAERAAARNAFAYSPLWLGETIEADGKLLVDIAPFLARDVKGIAAQLKAGGESGYKLVAELSTADPGATRVFPDNIELEARQTYVSDTPGEEVRNIAPDPRQLGLVVRHSLIRLPAPGYVPRRFDPRAGSFATQRLDFAAPLGQAIVQDLANRFRLERVDPTAARSRVKTPIVFYIDNGAPEPIRSALKDGAGWWAQAFEAAGLIDAYRVEILPAGADPLDIRYNVVNWVNRATRGWSYGFGATDPRTGEILKGAVLLGSLRVRQDMLIYEGLVGAAQTGTGSANDPAQVALARIRQLAAHEVGHALGLLHNFAASSQDRASVMDYPAPRVTLKDGKPDLSDAYGAGLGKWDRFAIDWLYADPPGQDPDAAGRSKAEAALRAGLRFTADDNGRAVASSQPHTAMWDDGPDPTAELVRLMDVRRAAIANFGLGALYPGEPVAHLRRKFVPVWLLHRYQVEAAAKPLGGLDSRYAVNGDGTETAAPVPAAEQRRALAALLATLDPAALDVPERLLPLLSAGWSGDADRQSEIEVFRTNGGTVFDPLAAAEAAATVTLTALLSPARLNRLADQQRRDAAQPGVGDVLDGLTALLVAPAPGRLGEVQRHLGTGIVLAMARTRRDPTLSAGNAARLDQALTDLAARLSGKPPRDGADRAWALSTARLLNDGDALERLLADKARQPDVPPGMPIGGASGDWLNDGL